MAGDDALISPSRLRRARGPGASGLPAVPGVAGRWVVAAAGVVYAAGLALLSAAVYADLPGVLAAYGDPTASWPILVQVAAGAVGFLTWLRLDRRGTRPSAVVLLTLGILTMVVLASASYSACPDAGLSRGWSVATRVVGLLANSYDASQFTAPGCRLGGPPLALQAARLAQVLVVIIAATSAVRALLRVQLDRVAARWARRTWVVLGPDDAAATLLPALREGVERGVTAVVVTPDPLAPWAAAARAGGWRVVVGDPHDAALLRSLLVGGRDGRHRRLRGLAVLAPDSTETQRLVAAAEAALGAATAREPVRALLRMDDPWQAEDCRRRYLGRIQQWVVDTISGNEVTARLLVEDVLGRGVERVLVTGHSDLTFAVVAELAQQARERAVLADGRTVPPVVLVGPTAQEVRDEHALSQARFGNQVAAALTVDADRRLADVASAALGEGRVTAVLFTGEVPVDRAPVEQRSAARLGATYPGLFVYSRRAEVSGLGAEPLLAQVRAFGTTLDAGGGRPVDSWERMARLQHERFVRAFPDPTLPSRRDWPDLSRFYRESNVRQVLTTLTSAVAVGRSWGASTASAAPVNAPQLERMARLEHEDWCDHHRRHGWRHAEVRDDRRRRHPDLRGWDDLPEDSRDKTRAGVRGTLDLLATLGYRSFDDPARAWRRYRRTGEVTARRRATAWTWTASDGAPLQGRSGDWEVTDAGGSRSVAPSIFASTHEHLAGDRWRRTGLVDARPAVPGEAVVSLEGPETAREGQFVLRGTAGEEWLVPAAHLARAYEPVEPGDVGPAEPAGEAGHAEHAQSTQEVS